LLVLGTEKAAELWWWISGSVVLRNIGSVVLGSVDQYISGGATATAAADSKAITN